MSALVVDSCDAHIFTLNFSMESGNIHLPYIIAPEVAN
jgi:hypothetical protein